jgi:hypothetical protein
MAEGFGGGSIGDELYRSDDAGATWRKVSPAGAEGRPQPQAAAARAGGWTGANPPYYYGQIRVDPNDKSTSTC